MIKNIITALILVAAVGNVTAKSPTAEEAFDARYDLGERGPSSVIFVQPWITRGNHGFRFSSGNPNHFNFSVGPGLAVMKAFPAGYGSIRFGNRVEVVRPPWHTRPRVNPIDRLEKLWKAQKYRPPVLFVDLKMDPRGTTIIRAVNSDGFAVGEALDEQGHWRAFLYHKRRSVSLGAMGGVDSSARGINDAGMIVGAAQSTAQGPPGSTSLGWLGQADPPPLWYVRGNNSTVHAFVYSQGKMRDLTPEAQTSSIAMDINNAGDTVGSYARGDSTEPVAACAFLYSGGQFIDLNSRLNTPTRVHLLSAVAIDDHGRIAAIGCPGDSPGDTRLYVLTPTP